MPQAAPHATRKFSVHARHIDHYHARLVDEPSFEAAAIAYVEDFHPPMSEGNEISVIVREITTGHQHCFRIDLESGDTSPCG